MTRLHRHFTTFLCSGTIPQAATWELHRARLYRDAQALNGILAHQPELLDSALRAHRSVQPEVVRINCAIDPQPGMPPIEIVTRPLPERWRRPIRRCQVQTYQREYAHYKHGNIEPTLDALHRAHAAGYDDVIFRDPASGYISEGSFWTLLCIDAQGTVWLPGAVERLPGVTEQLLRSEFPELGWQPLPLKELSGWAGLAGCNAVHGVREVGYPDPVAEAVISQIQRRWSEIMGILPASRNSETAERGGRRDRR